MTGVAGARIRRLLALGAVALAATGLAGCASAPQVNPTGETTTVQVRMLENRFEPNLIEVPVGNELVIELLNDHIDVHDLKLESGPVSSRLAPGQTETLDAGVIGGDIEGWCTVPPHREHGMELTIKAV